MIDHDGYNVSDFARATTFYTQALGAIGYPLLLEFPAAVTGRVDVAGFRAAGRSPVDAFYRAALAAGGRDNGAPGLRPHYHTDYYVAFVHDPDGHNVEVVCHVPA